VPSSTTTVSSTATVVEPFGSLPLEPVSTGCIGSITTGVELTLGQPDASKRSAFTTGDCQAPPLVASAGASPACAEAMKRCSVTFLLATAARAKPASSAAPQAAADGASGSRSARSWSLQASSSSFGSSRLARVA
jgi:hypothetical protein